MRRVVAVVARAHGVRGEVALSIRTDIPDVRLRPGATLLVEPPTSGADHERGPHGPDLPTTLTVCAARAHPAGAQSAQGHQPRWLVRFDNVSNRDEAERLRGCRLLVDVAPGPGPGPGSPGTWSAAAPPADAHDPDVFADHLLEGLSVVEADTGTVLGSVAGVLHHPAQDLLEVRLPGSSDSVLLPFVRALVPRVDLGQGIVLARPPGGLFEQGPASS